MTTRNKSARVTIALKAGSAPIVTQPAAPLSNSGASFAEALKPIASTVYKVEGFKVEMVDKVRALLAIDASEAAEKAVRVELICGIAARRLTCEGTPAKRIAYARDLYLNYQAPADAEAGEVPPVRKGKKGRRTDAQQRVIRNAEQSASKYLAEAGYGNAKTESESQKAKAKRKPKAGQGATDKGKATPPTVADTLPRKVDSTVYVETVLTLANSLAAFDKKHAGVRPITHGAVAEAIEGLRILAVTASKAFTERQREMAAIAKAAGPEKAPKPRTSRKVKRATNA